MRRCFWEEIRHEGEIDGIFKVTGLLGERCISEESVIQITVDEAFTKETPHFSRTLLPQPPPKVKYIFSNGFLDPISKQNKTKQPTTALFG